MTGGGAHGYLGDLGHTLVTALLSNTIVSPGRAKVAAIHTPYISALYIVCGPGIRDLLRILPLTTPVLARACRRLPAVYQVVSLGEPVWCHSWLLCDVLALSDEVPAFGWRLASGCRHLAIPRLPEGTGLERRKMQGSGLLLSLPSGPHMWSHPYRVPPSVHPSLPGATCGTTLGASPR